MMTAWLMVERWVISFFFFKSHNFMMMIDDNDVDDDEFKRERTADFKFAE